MDNREIKQLFFGAQFYYSEAKKLYNKIDKTLLKLSLEQWDNEFKNDLNKYKNSCFFHFSCHLDSCAIRLYAIDEKKGKSSNRWKIYDEQIWLKNNNINESIVKQIINNNIDKILHILLRHGTAHTESKTFPKYQKALTLLIDKYKSISHEEIFNILNELIIQMEKEV